MRVPATSANLGPGFDCFGLALARYDEVTAAASPGGLSVDVAGEGADVVTRDASHLVVRSMLAGFRRWNQEPPGLRVRCQNVIPHGRGLGSSAAAIVAGLAAARALLADGEVGETDVLDLATELEGHPDNVAAALGGGFTLAWMDRTRARSVRLVPHEDLLPVVCVPGWQMSTGTARGLLPDSVSHEDAVFNAARSGLLVAAVTQRPGLLMEATEDRLHQSYRAAAMRPTAELLSHLREGGVPAVISGAGPTVLALCHRGRTGVQDVHRVAEATSADWSVEELGVDLAGVQTERVDAASE